jgi:hypothetical protein
MPFTQDYSTEVTKLLQTRCPNHLENSNAAQGTKSTALYQDLLATQTQPAPFTQQRALAVGLDNSLMVDASAQSTYDFLE